MKNYKKGFTLLELVVVIAVIAILAAILLPTFTGIINRSKLSNDIMLCKNLNTASAAVEIDNNAKPKNMQEALTLLAENGFTVERIKTSNPDNIFVYDSVNNRFFVYDFKANKVSYFDENTTINMTDKAHKVNYWIISETYTQTNENLNNFSVYLKSGYTGSKTIEISSGLDVGFNTNIEKVIYSNNVEQTVTIRTNGSMLEIKAPNDTVYHYGEAKVLNIESVADASYHEFGNCANAQMKKGHIIIENKQASIKNLLLIAKDADSFDSLIVEVKNGAEMPTLDRTVVTIGTNGTKVCVVTDDTTSKAIWLYSDGVFENIKVTSQNATSIDESENVPEVSTMVGKASFEIANVLGQSKPTLEDILKGVEKFSGGAGTENSPYLILNGPQFNLIKDDLVDKHYKIGNDITIIESDFEGKYLIDTFTGTLNGNNFLIEFPSYPLSDEENHLINSFAGTIKNLKIKFNNFGNIANLTTQTAIYDNVDVYGDIVADSNFGAYVYNDKSEQIIFKDCDFYGTIMAGGDKNNYNAIYVGYVNGGSASAPVARRISFENCHNYGSVFSGDAAMFIAGASKTNDVGARAYITIDIKNCFNNGVIEWIDTTGYRPYNHFMATNIQEANEININDVKYVKVTNKTEEQIAELNIDGTTVVAMEQINSQHPTGLWSGTRLYKHISPTMPDATGSNYVVAIPDDTLNIYLIENGSFRLYKATATVAYYEITNKTLVHFNGASQVYTVTEIVFPAEFSGKKYTTKMKNYTFVDDAWINDSKHPERQGGEFETFAINENEYQTYTVNGETHYYYHDENFYFASDLYKNKPGTVYVSAYDTNGKVVASAKLSNDPEPTVALPSWYVAFDSSTMTNLVTTGVTRTNLSEYYNPDNTSLLKQGKYITQNTGYEGSGGIYDYSTGYMKLENVTNDTYIIMKTKATLSNSHDRLFFGSGTSSVYHYGNKLANFSSYGLSKIEEFVDDDGYHYYKININDFYISKIKQSSTPETIEDVMTSFEASGASLFIRVSVYGEGCEDTLIYKVG